ncbi:cell division protein [Megamonas hypermegale]|uniref:cell division protein FtsQ/DivIB n=1 Tax=Megamonas hypermegale TaxID=158847 RepID=UPI000B36F86E|nr:FtsQ-type POTRA domain-containing protein [Megamonas hypermegale]OUO41420.1 cell division protein [Megamonas hypermegale]
MSKNPGKSRQFISKRNIVRGLIGLFSILMLIFIINSPLLKIGYVKVTGNSYLPREDVLQIARIKEPLNIFSVQTDVIQDYLQNDLRIDTAKVWRDFPNCLNIEITERLPVAVMNCNYGYVNLDKNSVVIDIYTDAKKIQKPVITGMVLQDVYIGDSINDDTVKKILVYLGLLNNEVLSQIRQVNIADKEHIELYTVKGTKIILGNLNNVEKIAEKTQEIFKDMSTTTIPVEYIDLSYSRPVLKIKQ